ncbi:nicotinamide-nucleotide amidohydrolase family protein [Anaerovibrio sp.]|uniref:CinA family protein n=1 Tax=Anaerovibrio sp. TaxID=1872532 RepID=UPI0025FA2F76|nr:nicotinamide-nucleotide amidohydrolase family protein [Anaerovibrio sp.]
MVGRGLMDASLTIACAESCTGGLLTSRLTDVSGSSDYVVGSVIAYSNKVKKAQLGVQEATLQRDGAVSSETALEMAGGVCTHLGADIGVGITGIAGPGGGSVEKPVGLVYISVAGSKGNQVTKNVFSGSRQEIKKQAVDKALTMLLDYLK